MADNISSLYEIACKKGVLDPNTKSEEWFREQISTEKGLRSFYDYATNNGMKIRPYDEFKQKLSQPIAETPQPAPQNPSVKDNPAPTTEKEYQENLAIQNEYATPLPEGTVTPAMHAKQPQKSLWQRLGEFAYRQAESQPEVQIAKQQMEQDAQRRIKQEQERAAAEARQKEVAQQIEKRRPMFDQQWNGTKDKEGDAARLDKVMQAATEKANAAAGKVADEYADAYRYSGMQGGSRLAMGLETKRAYNKEASPDVVMNAFTQSLDEDYQAALDKLTQQTGGDVPKEMSRPMTEQELAAMYQKAGIMSPEDYEWYRQYVQEKLQEKFAAMNVPQNKMDYFVNKFMQSNLIGQLATLYTNTPYQRAAQMQGVDTYEQEHNDFGTKAVGFGADVAGLLADPTMLVMPMVGSAVGGTVVRGIAGNALEKIGYASAQDIAARAMMQRGILQTANRLAGSAFTFAGIDATHDVVNQLYQPVYNEETGQYENGDWHPWQTAKAAAKGAITGTIFGGAGLLGDRAQHVIGEAWNKTAGLIAGKATHFVGGTNAMVGTSVVSQILQGRDISDINWGEEYANAAAMQLVFDIQGGVRNLGKVYRNAAESGKPISLPEAFKLNWQRMKADPYAGGFTQEEIEQFNKAWYQGKDGYEILLNMNGGKEYETLNELYTVLDRIAEDPTIDTQAKYRLASLIYGKVDANVRPVMTDAYQDEQGRYVVRTYDNAGQTYETRHFNSERKAQDFRNERRNETQGNLKEWQEGVIKNYFFATEMQRVVDAAVDEIQKQYPQYTREQLYDIMREAMLNPHTDKGKAIAQDSEASAIRRMFEEYLSANRPQSFDVLGAIRQNTADNFGITSEEVRNIIGKDYRALDMRERGIYDDYVSRLSDTMPKSRTESQQTSEPQPPQGGAGTDMQALPETIRRETAAEVEPNTNKDDGNVYAVTRADDETKRGYVVSGKVEIDTTDPAAPRISNNDVVTVRYEDGTIEQLSAKDLNLAAAPSPATDVIQQITDERVATAQVAEQAAQTFHAGQEVTMDDGNGNTYTSRVVSVSEDGVEVEIENAQGEPDTTIIPNEIALTALYPIEQTEQQTQTESTQNITPIGEGDFGYIYDQFAGKPKEAIAFLTEQKSGEALGALHHNEVGDIDLVWGYEGTGKSDGFGLAKLLKYHPEVVDNLQEILNDMHVVKRSENRIQLESDKYAASVRLTWNDEKKTWLLTAFQKKSSAINNTTDTAETPKGMRNDTATPQSTANFTGKGTTNSANVQVPAPNIDTMSYSELGAATVEYMGGDRATAVAYLEAERDKADKEVKRLAKQSVKNYTDIADFKRQNDELQAAKKAAADRYTKLQNAITAANHYQTQAEQAEETARKAREEEKRAARRQTQTAQLANPAPAERWQAAPKAEGNAVTRTLPDGTTIRGHYVLVEAGAATPSHDPFNGWNTPNGFPVTEDGKNINDRDYKNDMDARQITTQIAQTYDGQAVAQVPVVSSEGIVYDGNGRTIAGNIAAANNTDGAYIQALADNAGNFGFTAEQVAGMQHPRVYMQTDEDLPYNTTTFAKFNAQEKKSQGSTNRAVSSSKKLTDAARDGILRILDNYGTLDAFFASETGAKDIVRSLLDNSIITQQEVAGLTENTDRGFVLSPAGKDYVTDLLIGGLFDEQTIRMLGNDKGLKQSILRAMPSFIENRRLGDYALTDNINGAIRLLYEARQAGVAYPLYIRQVDAFEGKVSDRFSPFEMLLAEEMSSGVENFRQVLNLYNNSARDDANGQTGLFEPRTIEDIKNEILQHYANRKQQPTAAAEPTTRPANPQTQPPLPSTPTGARQGGIESAEQANSATEESTHTNEQQNEQSRSGNHRRNSEGTPKDEQSKNTDKQQSQSQQSGNKIFTDDAYEAARRRMHERLNRLNAGLDPEMLSDGLIMAGYHVEKGARKFAEFAREMIREFGDKIRPYLKSFYNGLRDLPEAAELSKEMDDYGTVAQFDVNRISIEEHKVQNNKPNGLMRQYREIKAQYPDALLLFRTGENYELYAQDAVDANQILNIGSSTTNRLGEQTSFAKIPYQALDSFLPKLVRAGRRVAICDPIEDTQKTKSGVSEVVTPREMVESTEKSSNPLPNTEKSVTLQPPKVDVEGLFGALNTKGEAKLSDHTEQGPLPSKSAEDTQPIGKVTQSKHTKTGEDIWIVKPSERVSDDEFKLLRDRAKANNGYYSSFSKNRGFIFKSEEDANNFNNISDEEITTDQTSADTETAVRTAETVVGETAAITRDRRDSNRADGEPRTESIEGGVREPRNVELTPEQANEQVATRQQAIAKIDNANDKVTNQLAVLGFYEADTTDPAKFHESYGYIKTAEAKAVKDIDRLAKQLADDLGIKVSKRKTIAKANIAPAGGDISFRLPLENGKELYLSVDIEPNFNNYYRADGDANSLVADHLFWRIEDPQANGTSRYLTPNQNYGLFERGQVTTTYADLLRGIRRTGKNYLPTIPAGTTKQEIAKQVEEKATRKKKDTTRIADTQPMLDLFGDVADTMNEGAQQEQDGWNPQARADEELRHGYNVGDKVQYQGKTAEIVGFDNGRLVLDLMGGGWNTKLARFDEVEPINKNIFTEDDVTHGRVLLKNGDIKDILMVHRSQYIGTKEKPRITNIVFTDGTSAKFEDIAEINVQQNPINNGNTEVRTDGRGEDGSAQTEPTRQSRDENGALGGSEQPQDERPVGRRVGTGSKPHRVHDGERSAGTPVQPAEQTVTQSEQTDIEPSQWRNTHNFHARGGERLAPTAPKARYEANLAAIRLLKQLQDEGRQATAQEKDILAQYSGWGGLGEFFKGEPGTTYYSQQGEQSPYQVLQSLLTDEELQAAQLSRNSAYYTPESVINSMWQVAERLGFKGGNILEGSAGIGNIFALMPKDISHRSNLTAVEIDDITAGILAQLYPDATTYHAGFQDVDIPNNSQDLVITNVPFVTGLHVYDKQEKDLSKRFGNIHDFCIAKNVRKLKQGGFGIFISSSGTLDNSKDLRVWLNNEGDADVIGAFRLNRETFGGTSATSDIIVVRKRVNGQKDPRSIDVLDTATDRITKQPQDEVWNKKTMRYEKPEDKEIKLVYNKYFVEHPLSMGGEMGFGFEHGDTRWGGTTAGCYPEPTINQAVRLKDWIDSIKQSEQLPTYDELKQGAQVPNGTYETYEGAVPYGSLILNSKGEICKAYHGTAVPVEGINSNKVKGYPKAQVLKDYNAIKQAIDNLLLAQTKNVSDGELKPYLQQLNRVYDDFVRKYGNLNRNTSLAFLRNDVQWASVAAIEKVKETVDVNGKKKIQVAKTDLFSKRVVGVQAIPKAENTRDGIILSMQQFGTIRPDKIAEWLGKPTDEVEKEIIGTRLGFRDPQTGNIQVRYEYLSGNVREKLAYAEEHNEDGSLDANIEELRKVIPVDIPAHLIEFNIGSTWIPKELYLQYAKEKYDLDNLKLNHVGSAWVSNDVWGRNEKNRSEGVYSDMLGIQIYGHELMLAAMNNVPVVVSRVEKHSDGTSETRTDKVASAACSDKISQIKDDFVDWARGKMQQDSELADRIQKIYNDRFNAIVPMLKVDKEFLSEHLPRQNSAKYTLYPHQQQAVARGLTQALMLAHEVGTGKTISLISTAMEMRRLGTAKKPMIVVQNATTQQFVADAKDLYPNAKILTVSDRDRTAEGRQEFYAKIKYNDWDLIIVPQSVFDMIPDSEARMRDFINEKIEEKMHAIEAAKEAGLDNNVTKRMERELGMLQEDLETNNMSGKRSGKKAKEKDAKKEAEQRANTEARAQAMLDRKTDDIENFDEMGIDALLIDEAHNYKHLGFATMMTRGVKGVDPSYSKRAAALYLKCQSIYERNGHKNVIFATGTPISNTAAEIWTFMKYLMPKQTLQENEIYYFDDFVHNFGKINEQLEFATNGKFKANNRFAQYGNVPELMRLWLSVADCTLTREVGQVNDKVPELERGKAQDIFLPQSPSLIDIMNAVRAQLEEYENMSGKEKRENSHIPLTMYGIAKRAAIDPRLVDANAVDEPLSKTNRAVEEVLRSLNDSKKYKGTVAIFCDSYQNKQSGFNLFNDIKEKLTKQGVPANQIAIIRSEMSDSAKQKIFDAVREGDIRVIMGSTQTLGTGVNIQTRLHTLIHMDAPDRPMDYTQRNGRILRQGNMHKEWAVPVRVLRFGVEDSLDVTSYQRLKTKAGFIDSIMNGKSMIENNLENRVLEDVDEGIFDNPVAMLSGSQYALLKSQAERDLRKWSARAQQHRIDQILIAKKTKDNEKIIAYRKQKIADNEKLIDLLSQTFPDGKVSESNINGTVCHAAEEVKNALKEVNKDVTAETDALRKDVYGGKKALSYPVMLNGVPFNVDIQLTRKVGYKDGQSIVSVEKEVLYSAPTLGIEPITSPTKVIDRLIDMIQDDIISGKQARNENAYSADYIQRLEKENALMREREGKPFEHQAELEKAQTLVDEYTKKMQAELAEKEAKYANQSHNSVNLDKMDSEDDATDTVEAQYEELDYDTDNLTDAQQLATDTVLDALDNAGIPVERVSEEEAEREVEKEKSESSVRLIRQMAEGTKGQSNNPITGAKVQKNLEDAKEKYKKYGISTENAITDISKALGARNTGTSNYITIEAKNSTIFTLRLSNHNATVANFDNNGETNGISIVISRHDNKGITNNGDAHIVKFFYSDKSLNKADGTPIADIIGALEQTMYSGEYTDPTGLAQRQEVNIPAELQSAEFSIRQTPAPKNTGIGYKVFYRSKDGKLYPPMVANPNGADTPIGVWLNADAAPISGESKTGRPQVKAGGKGTQGGSGQLAYRPGWHLGEIPYALQFNRKDENGDKTLFPKDFVWAEVEYAADVNYQQEAEKEGITENGKYRHSYAGLKHLPTDGYYRYRTNPNPETDPWIITGAMKVNRVLTNEEVDDLVRKAGREPQQREFLRTSNGTIYGYAKDGKIYLTNKGFNPNTPIHEYTHLWVKAVRNNNAELYGNLRDLFSRENLPDMWDELDNDPQYRDLSDEAKLSEIIARFSGKRGAERMEQEAQKLIDEAKQHGKRAIADAVSLRERMHNLLRRFLNWVGEHLFHIKHFGSREEAADRVLYDLLNGTDLGQTHSENDGKAEFSAPSAGDSSEPQPRLTRSEVVTKILVQNAKNDYNTMQAALNKVSQDIKGIRTAMRLQSGYDRNVVSALLNLYNTLLQSNNVWAGYMPDTTQRVATQIVNAIGKQDISKEVNTIMDYIVDAQAKAAQRQWDKLRQTPIDKINISGVVAQGKVALQGQYALKALNSALESKLTADQLEEMIGSAMANEENATDESLRTQYKGKWIGYSIAQQYLERVEHLKQERLQLLDELNAKRADKALKPAARQQVVDNIKEMLRDNNIEQANAYIQSARDLQDYIAEQGERAKGFIEKQNANREKIRGYAAKDLAGVATNPNRLRTKRSVARSVWDAFASPIRDLQSMLRLCGMHAPDGEGYLYNHFMRNWIDGVDRERQGIVEASKTLDSKIADLTRGKYKTWEEAARKINNASRNKFSVTMLNGVDKDGNPVNEDIPLNAGNALYIYAVNKMEDGKMKLAAMNITDADVEKLTNDVREKFGQEIIDVVDWIQSEYFSQLRNRYNPIHEDLFGAPMDAIENYFPLRINANARQKNEDLGDPDTEAARLLTGTSTGAIKRRTRNTLPLDVRNADFFSEVIRHIAQMERWSAFAQWTRDANILFSDIDFRNRIKGMDGTIYGSGDQLYNHMKDAFRVAVGTYKPNTDAFSEFTLNAAKGVTSAKINFRLFTAIKQLASFPAFLTYMTDGVFVRSYMRNWLKPHETMKWAKTTLPNFEKRVSKRDMGDMRLMQRSTDWQWNKRILEISSKYGMAANVLFDTLTCATGARAVYDSRYAEYKQKGYTEEEAANRARQDAEMAFNTSQQSSEGAFMAPIQLDRNLATAALTVFRTSNFQYTRNLFYNIRNLKNKLGQKEEMIASRKQQYIADGLTEEQARRAAEHDWSRSNRSDIIGIVVYGALLNLLWRLFGNFPYLIFGDDNDKKAEIARKSVTGGAFASPVTGLLGGGIVEQALDGYGDVSDMFAPELPFTQDVKKAMSSLKNDRYAEFASQALSVLMQSGAGFDPQTAADMIARVVTTLDSEQDLDAAEQALRVSQAVLSIPQSQYEQMLIDEVIDNRRDYRDALADYQRYMSIHKAPLTWYMRSDESENKTDKSAKTHFDRLMKERKELRN